MIFNFLSLFCLELFHIFTKEQKKVTKLYFILQPTKKRNARILNSSDKVCQEATILEYSNLSI